MTEPADPLSGIQERVASFKSEIDALTEEQNEVLASIEEARGKLADVQKRLKDTKLAYQAEAKELMGQLKDLTRVRKQYKRRTPVTPESPDEAPTEEG